MVKKAFWENDFNFIESPSQFPDLNPIENLWSELKSQVLKQECSNYTQMWENIEKAWYSISVETCRKLMASMPRKVDAVLKNNGGYTAY